MLHGRAAERARLDHVVAEARASRGGALVVRGEPGVGKTALLSDLTERADAVDFLWTAGIESESPLAFAALHRLLRPVLAHTRNIPSVQARALHRALGAVEESPAAADPSEDRFLVFVATLSLLAEVAEGRPVVCIVDDAHWLDAASAEALSFVARRLQADRIALFFSVRNGQARLFEGVGLPELVLPGLAADAAAALLTEQVGRTMTLAVGVELTRRTGGNPLALVELPGVLTDAQLLGRVGLPAHLPLTQGVERAFLDRCRRLPPDAQTMLLVVATDDSAALSIVQEAAAELGAGDAALDAAERSGLVQVREGTVQVRHPLVRSAVYGAATTSQRRRVHGALATAMRSSGDPDRGAWQAAQAASGPDDTVADALEAVGVRATHRGGHEAASATAERAATLSSTPAQRGRRLLTAAESAWSAGDGSVPAPWPTPPGRRRTTRPPVPTSTPSAAGSSGTSGRRRPGGVSSCARPTPSPSLTRTGPWPCG